MTANLVLVDRSDDHVATITLNDPERRNALSYDLLDELHPAFVELESDPDVRCILIASSHATTFSAGGNLSKMSAQVSPMEQYDNSSTFPDLMVRIAKARTPTICAASGHLLAGAMGLALACDLVYASERATFGTPEINVGVFPFMVSALLYRNVGRKVATELLLRGERIDAQRARAIGIVNDVFAPESFAEEVRSIASSLASKSPLLMGMGKQAIAHAGDMSLEQSVEYLHHRLVLALTTEDIREGVDAFFTKRDPVWRGR